MRARGSDLRVVHGDRGRHGDKVGVSDMGRVVADGDTHAECAQSIEAGRFLQVGAGHAVTHCREDGRDLPSFTLLVQDLKVNGEPVNEVAK